MKVVVAPDSFGGTLTAPEAAAAIVAGWSGVRPDDEVVSLPLSDGGEGLLDVVARPEDVRHTVEVAGPHGHPLEAAFLLRPDGTAVIESASACGLHLLPAPRRTHRSATSYGVGQLLDAARQLGASRILLGLGGTASIDGGTGALLALGYRLTVADGSGLKIGGEDVGRVAHVTPGWSADWGGVEVTLLADVDVVLADAVPQFGPQKGVTPEEIPTVSAALAAWADVVERDLAGRVTRHDPGTGAAGGLGYGLARALPRVRSAVGAAAVADLVGLDAALRGAELVVTGEGRLDATSAGTKVVGHLLRTASVPVVAVVGGLAEGASPPGLSDVEAAAPAGPGPDPAAEVSAAAARLAARAG